MSFDYRQLDIYSGMSDKEIGIEMNQRLKSLPSLYSKIANNEPVTCALCNKGTYVNQVTTFYCNYCGHQVIFN